MCDVTGSSHSWENLGEFTVDSHFYSGNMLTAVAAGRLQQCGELAEWLKALVLKTSVG